MQEGNRDGLLDRLAHLVHRVGGEDHELRAAAFELTCGAGHLRAERVPVARALVGFDGGEIDRQQQAARVVVAAKTRLRVAVEEPVILSGRFPTHAADNADRFHLAVLPVLIAER